MPLNQAFTHIYDRRLWGEALEHSPFFSGPGSHDERTVSCYENAVVEFIHSLDAKPDVVDLGCGDFSVGSHIRPLCRNYIACDIVEPLIEFNRKEYESQNVDFRVLDFTRDRIPSCEVLFLRQVLQHLSNKHIKKALPKLVSCCKYLVLTEHLPHNDPFTPNIDIPAGPTLRLELNSGVILTHPPFKMKALEERVLCEIADVDGRLRTTLYRFGEFI